MRQFMYCLLLIPILTGTANADFVGNGDGFVIIDNDPVGGSSDIVVNLSPNEQITDVSITMTNLTHLWVGDLIARLTGPAGTVDIMFRTGDPQGNCCGDSSDLGADYTFNDSGDDWWAAAAATGGADIIPSGTYAPTTIAGTATSMVGLFGGTTANGTWTLTISDVAGGGGGNLDGWTLNITSSAIVPEPHSGAWLGAMVGLVLSRRRKLRGESSR